MSTDNRIVPGVVKNGVVVPQSGSELPDGAHVNIILQPAEMPQELREELEAWQRAGNTSQSECTAVLSELARLTGQR